MEETRFGCQSDVGVVLFRRVEADKYSWYGPLYAPLAHYPSSNRDLAYAR